LNATVNYPNIEYHTDSTPQWSHSDFVTPMLVGTPERVQESGMWEAMWATSLALEYRIDTYELLLYLQTERSDAGLDEEHIEFLRVQLRFFQHDIGSGTAILVDLGDSEETSGTQFDPKYQQVIDDLRNTNRELLAQELIEMLQNSQEDPEEADIQLNSLQAMARFLVKHREFEDPVSGPDPRGTMQIEWHIAGNGLLVMAFVENDRIHCVVQADATPQRGEINRNERLKEREVIEAFGHLVPLR
jgi:hypothetical protein